MRVTRRYRPDTLILETDFETVDGAVTLIDFMPPRRKISGVVRMIVGRCGQVAMRNEFIIRFDYGSAAKRLVGNFPCALSHIALVNTAHNLARSAKPARQRSGAPGR